MTADETRAAFEGAYDRAPTTVASAPGRVNLVGGHTDYTEGFVLPVAVDRRTSVAVAPREDGGFAFRTTAFSADVDVETLPDTPIADSETSWANYPIGVVHELRAADLWPDDVGADVLVDGDVPRGAGLSSSAALEVATAAALVAVEGGELPRRTLANAAWRAETGFVGLDCGIMDQYASACCRADTALFLDCRSRETELVPLDSGERVDVVVVDTGVEHELASSAYNDRVRECAEATERLAERVDGIETLRDVSREMFVEYADSLPGPLRRRVRHVVTENQRVRSAVDALHEGDVAAVGTYMNESHASLRDDYEVSCAELDAVINIAWRTEGVLGARMTGGGFGGSVVALVRPEHVEDFRTRVTREYVDSAPADADPRVFVCQSADGVRLER